VNWDEIAAGIWNINPKLPWHVGLALLELSAISYAVPRFREGKQTWILGAVGLVLAIAAHVVYSIYFASKYVYVGPHAIPWPYLFYGAEAASIGWMAWYWYKHKKFTQDMFLPTVIAVGAHIFWAMRLSAEHPTFELEVRWYGVFFAIGLMLGARAFPIYFERWGFKREDGQALCLWTPVGMLLGAHFVHLIFYEWEETLENPIRLFQLGSGLASHGGGLGAIVGLVLYARRRGITSFAGTLKWADAGMCASTLVIPWVRVGNFFNSEIIGRAWDGPWAIIFPRSDEECGALYHQVPNTTVESCRMWLESQGKELVSRHPSQIYEAIVGFIMSGIAIYLAARWRNRLRPGAILFILLGFYFSTRFCIELLKDRQGVDDHTFLSMGQMLSILPVLISAYMLLVSKTSNIRSTVAGPEILDNPPKFPPEPIKAETVEAEGEEPAKKRAKKRKKKKQ
jgi:phosphatidylglycerol:prolipoprotein diacylglycerol transferase